MWASKTVISWMHSLKRRLRIYGPGFGRRPWSSLQAPGASQNLRVGCVSNSLIAGDRKRWRRRVIIVIPPIAALLPHDYCNSTADGQAQNTNRRPLNRGESACAANAILVGYGAARIRDRPVDPPAVARQVEHSRTALNAGSRID